MRLATLKSRRERVVRIVTALPEAEATGGQHLKFTVRKKGFGYFLDDHHGDGKVAICCKAAPGVMGELVELDPDRYFVPAYLGAKGWVALRIDQPKIEWAEVSGILEEAYRLSAPKRLVAELDALANGERAPGR